MHYKFTPGGEQILKACLERNMILKLGTDGSYNMGKEMASFGWLLIGNQNVLIQGAGPVGGDLDIPQPNPPLIETVEEQTVPQMEQDEPTQVAQPMETTGLRRSTRVKIQPKLYEPTMTGSKYSDGITQLETHGVLYPDSHMLIQEDFYQSDPDVVAHIMKKLSLKSGLKQWGDKAYAAVTSEMKQLHFRDTFKPKHWSELSKTQRQTVLESHMLVPMETAF
jgi:hypothetical protein